MSDGSGSGGGGRRRSGRRAGRAARAGVRQPLCPPAGSRTRLHLLRHPGRKGNKGREQFLLFSVTFFRAALPAQCCCPVTPAAAPRPPRSELCRGRGSRAHVPATNPWTLLSTSTETGTAFSAGLSQSPQLLSYSTAPLGIPEVLSHGNMAVLG